MTRAVNRMHTESLEANWRLNAIWPLPVNVVKSRGALLKGLWIFSRERCERWCQ